MLCEFHSTGVIRHFHIFTRHRRFHLVAMLIQLSRAQLMIKIKRNRCIPILLMSHGPDSGEVKTQQLLSILEAKCETQVNHPTFCHSLISPIWRFFPTHLSHLSGGKKQD